ALVDSGAKGMFINESFAKKAGLHLLKLQKEVKIRSVDGRTVHAGMYEWNDDFLVIDLGKEDVIIGNTWLHDHNLIINWQTG
ncbi:uncharacterized protein LAESUDRAFT_638140, partial [Laetiporus sulphureus 93-53]